MEWREDCVETLAVFGAKPSNLSKQESKNYNLVKLRLKEVLKTIENVVGQHLQIKPAMFL
jgi:hypothetical protein